MEEPKRRARKRICPEVVTDEKPSAPMGNSAPSEPPKREIIAPKADYVNLSTIGATYDGRELGLIDGKLVCYNNGILAWSSPCPGTPLALAMFKTYGAVLCERSGFHEVRVVFLNGGGLAWPLLCLATPEPESGRALAITEDENGKYLLLLHGYRVRVWDLLTNHVVFDQALTIPLTSISVATKPFGVRCKNEEYSLTYSDDFNAWVASDALTVDPLTAFFGSLSSGVYQDVERAFATVVRSLAQRGEVSRMDDLLCMFLDGPSWAYDRRIALKLEDGWVQDFIMPTLRQEHAFLNLIETYIERKRASRSN